MNASEQQQLIREELAAFRQHVARPASSCPASVHALLHYLHAHLFDEALTVNAALEACKLRSARIHARFKQHVGLAIGAYIRDRRVMAAMWLLYHEELHAQEIAYGIGYENYETFRRAFKSYVGVPPSEFRKRIFGRN